jgi:hypothetical protein
MIQVKSEQRVLQEGLQILFANMEPSEVARFWTACNAGSGDYLKLRTICLVKNRSRAYLRKS